jgi:UDP-N-acetylmuramoyl-L-alanyl-D-glutamate--2,6-diaminopimelate ligase
MEVSSHGIMLGRVIDIDYDVAVFTNLTRDHMEFHKDMEDYFDAKKKLFTEILAKSTKKNKFAIINIDCEYGARLIEFVKLLKDIKIYTYGFSKDADIKVVKHEYHDDGSLFSLDIEGKKYKFNIPIIGKHNISNAVAAISATMVAFNIDYNAVSKGIDEIRNIPGRLERVKKGVNVFVDYAHTDDALMNVLKSIKNVFPNKKVITVFGCGGDRDKGKRPRMGKTVSDFSDYAIVTSDNPRNEEPINIINSIIASMRADMYEVIVNRKEAIKKAISMLDKNTVILIAGKGHEAYQEIKGIKYAFDDREIAKEFL